MTVLSALWLMVWGGMFTGLYNVTSGRLFTSPLALFQGGRALLPILAAYLCVLWILAVRSPFPFMRSPIRFFLLYIATGLIASAFLSPQKITALYWASAFAAPFLVIWVGLDRSNAMDVLRRFMSLNYAVFILLLLALLPEVVRGGSLGIGRQQFYMLPFGLGDVRANGVGRYALIIAIVSVVRLTAGRGRSRLLWLALLVPGLYILARTQSRTALLGLAVAGILFVLIRGLDRRLLLVGPIFAYVVWISGLQWRAGGEIGRLVNLTGREYTWQKGLAQLKESPFLGWGFHADRLLLDSEHMHNSYLHAGIHAGIIGAGFFLAGLVTLWLVVVRTGLLRRIRSAGPPDQAFLMESVMILGFLTSRTFFESTGAFYGVDLLLLVPAMAYVLLWERRSRVAADTRIEGEAWAPGPAAVPIDIEVRARS